MPIAYMGSGPSEVCFRIGQQAVRACSGCVCDDVVPELVVCGAGRWCAVLHCPVLSPFVRVWDSPPRCCFHALRFTATVLRNHFSLLIYWKKKKYENVTYFPHYRIFHLKI